MNIVYAEVEVDDGYVTLVRAKKDEHGHIVECDEKEATIWAWKNPHKDGQGEIVYTELKGGIVLEDVDFGYEEDKMVLHNISLYAKPGQKVAFVGATGAGKTTITNLLNRFYDIADGKIRYDGININKIKKADLRKPLWKTSVMVNLKLLMKNVLPQQNSLTPIHSSLVYLKDMKQCLQMMVQTFLKAKDNYFLLLEAQ